MLEIGRQRASAERLDITWQEADAEHLPFGDDDFDVMMSCVGVMFAPFHQPVADELVRVTRPGGRIALANWTPGGFIGQLFATMRPFVPAPPPGATPGPRWGDEEHVRGLFGDSVRTLDAHKRMLRVEPFASGAQFRDFFAAYYGPTIAAYRNVADDPERTEDAQPRAGGPRRAARREQRRDGVGVPARRRRALTGQPAEWLPVISAPRSSGARKDGGGGGPQLNRPLAPSSTSGVQSWSSTMQSMSE